ncbi:MAG: SRPBCC domain-containing protein, partial [Fulvivirga sp.]|uniref:SRPBCC family protein n=1 Tax=Fulvivirga sp. TaxID=1931237 RepID=UPI0032EF2510
PYRLKYTWVVGDAPIETVVLWTLKEVGNVTKLSIEHSGISKLGDAAPESFDHFSFGWDACLDVLPNYLNEKATEPAH